MMLCAGGLSRVLQNERNVNLLRGEKQRSRGSRGRKPSFVGKGAWGGGEVGVETETESLIL